MVHDMAVTDVWVTPDLLNPFVQGTIHVAVENMGVVEETAARVKVLVEGEQVGDVVEVALQPEESTTVEFPWMVETVGVYLIEGRAEPTVQPDGDRSNNSLRMNEHVVGRDIAVTRIYTYPADPVPGRPAWLYVYVKNQGSDYDPDVRIKAFIEGEQVGETYHVGLMPGVETRWIFEWTPGEIEKVLFEGRGEPSDYPDFNRQNNFKRMHVHVVGHDVEVKGFFTIPGPPHAGAEARLGILVYNNSINREKAARVKLYVRGESIGEREIWLEPHAWGTVAIPYTFPAAGSYFVEGRIEPTLPPDYDRSDNYRRGYVTVVP
jgi:hypothetical protein